MNFDIRFFDSVASTMDLAKDAIRDGNAEGTVIQAGEQVSGRGRRGNQWTSPTGNLYQSIILKPSVNRQDWGQMSFVISVALAQSLLDILPDIQDLYLKWPNDVLIENKKLAGILIEAKDDYLIIGTGVNIQHAPDDRSKLSDFSSLSVNGFRDIFLNRIAHYYQLWQSEGFDPIQKLWMSRAYRQGQLIKANLNDRTIEGIFEKIDKGGALILRSGQGEDYKITSSEIINWDY